LNAATMTAHHDIYDPPPAPRPLEPPPPEPIRWGGGDLLALGLLCVPVIAASAWAWAIDSTLGWGVTIVGVFVILESWFSALTFLHRHPHSDRPGRRWLIYVAALVPWALALGVAGALMRGFFYVSDWML
jgi:hypothetical protein